MTARVAALGRLTRQGRATWDAIAELAERIPVEQWVVVGGQMVAIHAALADVEPPRVTDDGDVVVDVRSAGRHATENIATCLVELGFGVLTSTDNVTRFVRGDATLDVLAPEGIGRPALTIPPGRAVQAPGASQAIERRRLTTVSWQDGLTTINCPSLLGAIVAKAAASTEIASLPRHEHHKHLGDFVFLVSLATFVDAGAIDRADVTSKDRKRLRAATKSIVGDPIHPARRFAANFDDVVDLVDELVTA